jgi:hypothetical protein
MAETRELAQTRAMNGVDRELQERFERAYDENGVDRSLIRARLERTPEERLAELEENLNFVLTVRATLEAGSGQLSGNPRSSQ